MEQELLAERKAPSDIAKNIADHYVYYLEVAGGYSDIALALMRFTFTSEE